MNEFPRRLPLQDLDAAAFAPYGEVLDLSAGAGRAINAGTSVRRELPSALDFARADGRPVLATFAVRAQPLEGPWGLLERHVHGTQTFVPLQADRWLLLVARGEAQPDPATLVAFAASARQGVTLAPGTWHHPLVALDDGLFLVIERAGPEVDCEVVQLPVPVRVVPG